MHSQPVCPAAPQPSCPRCGVVGEGQVCLAQHCSQQVDRGHHKQAAGVIWRLKHPLALRAQSHPLLPHLKQRQVLHSGSDLRG